MTTTRKLWRLLALAGIIAAAPAQSSAQGQQSAPEVPMSAQDVLSPYLAKLPGRVAMPVAPPTPKLRSDTVLTRIAFGSCDQQQRSQAFWPVIAGTDPQAFLFIGDNVYGDSGWNGGADLASLRAAYAYQAKHKEFIKFRADIPMLTVWDDHDYGLNDGGASFAFRQFAQNIYQTYWDSPADIRARDGVYFSRIYGPEGKRLQLIMLDTRFFRSDIMRPAQGEPAPKNGAYLRDNSLDATMLGDAQWDWLQSELAKPADLRIVVSSVQVLTNAHNWEGWTLMPREREKLIAMLRARAGGGAVIVSGDRHAGAIYRLGKDAQPGQLWEITSSSLNLPFASTAEATEREPDPLRVGPMIGEANFGLLDIDWQAKTLKLALHGTDGTLRTQQSIRWSQ